MPPSVRFFNDSQFIRVENSAVGSVAYFNKETIVFQADSAVSFFLKSDGFTTYYLYADVEAPASASLAQLMRAFAEWVTQWRRDQAGGVGGGGAAASGAGDAAHHTAMVDVKTLYDKDARHVDELLAGGATSVYDAGRNGCRLELASGLASRAVRQSKAYAPVVGHKTQLAVVSGVRIDDEDAGGALARIGAFDDAADVTEPGALQVGNGLFFQWRAGQGLSVVLRSNLTGAQVDTVVPQASWNVDPLDGTGASGEDMDPTRELTFVLTWSSLSDGEVSFAVLVNGAPVVCHRVRRVRIGCAALPVRWELARFAEAQPGDAAARLFQGQGCVLVQGEYVARSMSRAFDTGAVTKHVTSAAPEVPLVSLRLSRAANRAHLRPVRVEVMNIEAGTARWQLLLNAALTAADFEAAEAGAFAEVSTAETAVAGGQVLCSGYIASGVQSVGVDLSDKNISLTSTIAGVADVLTVVVSYVRGVVQASASLTWLEQE